jgi:predicted lipoprotein with Yx(FWY)xxD motif
MTATVTPTTMRPERLASRSLGLGLVLAALVAATAFGSSSTTVRGAANATLGQTVLVNSTGRTLYSLSGESSHHLLCKTSECTRFWPPLSVPSRATKLKEGAGVHGTLGVIRRSNGTWQVTLRGKPLYRYSGDSASGQATGEGIHSFGGVWDAVPAASTTAAPAPMPAPQPESTPPYTY